MEDIKINPMNQAREEQEDEARKTQIWNENYKLNKKLAKKEFDKMRNVQGLQRINDEMKPLLAKKSSLEEELEEHEKGNGSFESIHGCKCSLELIQRKLELMEIKKELFEECLKTNRECLNNGELQCSICNKIFIEPTTLNCCHTFCKYCIDEWERRKVYIEFICPICKVLITSETPAIAVDNYIKEMIKRRSDTFKDERKKVVASRNREKNYERKRRNRSKRVHKILLSRESVNSLSQSQNDDIDNVPSDDSDDDE